MVRRNYIFELFGKKPTQIGQEDIEKLIKNKVGENLHLEYKDPRILSSNEQRNKLAKSVTGFLNADGGVLIIGIEVTEINGEKLPEQIVPVIGYTSEQILQMVMSRIGYLTAPDIEIFDVDVDVRGQRGKVYLLQIQKGDDLVYQAPDGRYYKRVGNTTVIMKHKEIAARFGKKGKPHLELIFIADPNKLQKVVNIYHVTIYFFVENKGKASARYPMFQIKFPRTFKINALYSKNGKLKDISKLYGGVPVIEWKDYTEVIHPNILLYTGGVRISFQDHPFNLHAQIEYVIVCEDMEMENNKITMADIFRNLISNQN